MKLISLITFYFLLTISIGAQSYGTNIYTDEALEGYTFFSPLSYESAYLVDNCGNLINSWDRAYTPGLSGYFLDNGLMLRTNQIFNFFPQASTGGIVELVEWDNTTYWSYEFSNENYSQHHDVEYMPNGNLLILGWEKISPERQEEMGRPVSEISFPTLWSEFIWEVEVVPPNGINIVWEWHLSDHLIQDHDPTKENFGNIAENPYKVDINYAGPGWWSQRDWWHCNAIAYNEDRNEVMLNSRNNNELWIIDHSTTTEEATTDSGGVHGKGGDLIYRWGNPQAYQQGTLQDLRMYGSHGNYWIENGMPNEGEIMYFNNGQDRPNGNYSTIERLRPVVDDEGFYVLEEGRFIATEPTLVFQSNYPWEFQSTFLSNAQQLENGNVLINEGGSGHIFEVNEDMDIVWDYLSPVNSNGPLVQGNSSFSRSIFRAYKFPLDFAGFDGVDLTPGSLLQINDNDPFCETDAVNFIEALENVEINYVLAEEFVLIINENAQELILSLYDVNGNIIRRYSSHDVEYTIQLNEFPPGIYILQAQGENGKVARKKMVCY